MRSVFLTTRSHFDRKNQRGGIAGIKYSFYGEKNFKQVINIDDRTALQLYALIAGLETAIKEEITPYTLQVDTDAIGFIRKYHNGKLDEAEFNAYKPYLEQLHELIKKSEATVMFKKGKDLCSQAMNHKAEIQAESEIQDLSFGMDQWINPGQMN